MSSSTTLVAGVGMTPIRPSVMTTATFMYRTGFSDGDFGSASAVSWLVFLVIAGLS